MNDLIVGVDDVVGIEYLHIQVDGWPYVTTHAYKTEMVHWCTTNKCFYGYTYVIQTYRLKNHNQNSHRWYFKDPEVATLFSLMFS